MPKDTTEVTKHLTEQQKHEQQKQIFLSGNNYRNSNDGYYDMEQQKQDLIDLSNNSKNGEDITQIQIKKNDINNEGNVEQTICFKQQEQLKKIIIVTQNTKKKDKTEEKKNDNSDSSDTDNCDNYKNQNLDANDSDLESQTVIKIVKTIKNKNTVEQNIKKINNMKNDSGLSDYKFKKIKEYITQFILDIHCNNQNAIMNNELLSPEELTEGISILIKNNRLN